MKPFLLLSTWLTLDSVKNLSSFPQALECVNWSSPRKNTLQSSQRHETSTEASPGWYSSRFPFYRKHLDLFKKHVSWGCFSLKVSLLGDKSRRKHVYSVWADITIEETIISARSSLDLFALTERELCLTAAEQTQQPLSDVTQSRLAEIRDPGVQSGGSGPG